ncbi:unnamed protein product [Echinostoma caproni]|uniref:Uncharacterized protein n=1 Tax=Echinostoma caproni TaxID=27848 RepID=A0A183BB75_9TREM|nr:unnamed protein product [Echinostoma caproni]
MLYTKPKPVDGALKTNSGTPRGSTRSHTTENKWPGLIGSLERHLVSLLPRVLTFNHPLSRDGTKSSTTTSSSSTDKDSSSNTGSSARNQDSSESNDATSETQSVRTSSILTSAAAASDIDVVLYTEVAPTTLTVHK